MRAQAIYEFLLTTSNDESMGLQMVVAPIVQLMDNLYEARFRFLEKMRTSQPRDTQEVRLEHAQLLKQASLFCSVGEDFLPLGRESAEMVGVEAGATGEAERDAA